MTDIKRVTRLDQEELVAEAKSLGAPLELVHQVAKLGKLPVPNFAAGGIATPADASLMMQLGAETVFVGSGILKVMIPPRVQKQLWKQQHISMTQKLLQKQVLV